MNKNLNVLDDYFIFLSKVDSLEKIDTLISDLNEKIYQKYPCISCNTGCYTCCTGASMPAVYAVEWKRIKTYLKSNEHSKILNNNNKLFNEHKPLLEEIHDFIHKKVNIENYTVFYEKMSKDLADIICPFHIDGKCSIYSVRPTMCRTYGSFLIVVDKQIQILTCNSDKAKIEDFLKEKKGHNLLMPYWNSFERKIIELSKKEQETYDFTILPIWLNSYFQHF